MNKYMFHLDDIRLKKNMSIDKLCNNICSVRQYYKYLSGTNNVSDKRLIEYCSNLSITPRDFYYSLYEKDKIDYGKVRKIYYELIRRKYKGLEMEIKKIEKTVNPQNIRFLDYCLARLKFEKQLITSDKYYSELCKIVDFPKCLDKKVFDFTDIISIHSISEIEVNMGKEKALNFIIGLLDNNEMLYLSAENKNILPTIYSSVSILLGRLGKYSECINIANKGIDYCTKYSLNKSLSWIYYARAIGYKNIHKNIQAEQNAALCFANALARQNNNEVTHFYNLLTKDFKKDPFTMFLNIKGLFIQDY